MMLRVRPKRRRHTLIEVMLFPDYEFVDVVQTIDAAVADDVPFSVLNRQGTELTFDPRKLDAISVLGDPCL